jgi:kynureninase
MTIATRDDCVKLDFDDPLAPLRGLFDLPDGVIYLDGNSLGPLPRATASRVANAITKEWGTGLIRSWNEAGWIDLPIRVGAKIARLIGASASEVVCADSTSSNMFKVLAAGLEIQRRARPQRYTIVSERSNFPTDLYIAQGLTRLVNGGNASGYQLMLVDTAEQLTDAIKANPAIVMLTHVNYRTGAMHDMAAVTRAAQQAGALVIWDLAHSAGALEVNLNGANADFAVGCGYKYLNGGPGAPAFVWAATRHHDTFHQPLSGWLGHDAPFAFEADYRPARGVDSFQCGTPAVLGMTALECGVDTLIAAESHGGLAALRAKSVALCELFISLVEARCGKSGLALVSPRTASTRGSQVSFSARSELGRGYPVMQALIARGVIGDFRAPDILRFGFCPLYTRFIDVWDAVEVLAQILKSRSWDQPQFHRKAQVT